MAFENFVVAISWRNGDYGITEKYSINDRTELDWVSLDAENAWNNVSENSSYQDFVMAVSKPMFNKCARGVGAKEFFTRTSQAEKHTMFYLIHRAEYESGMSID